MSIEYIVPERCPKCGSFQIKTGEEPQCLICSPVADGGHLREARLVIVAERIKGMATQSHKDRVGTGDWTVAHVLMKRLHRALADYSL